VSTPSPQPGIFAVGTRSHHHLELDLELDRADAATIDAVRGGVGRVLDAVGMLPVNVVVGFGERCWRDLAPIGAVPDDLADFVDLVGRDGHRAPATQHDLWVWVHGAGSDTVLDGVTAVLAALDGVARLAEDVPCFVYHDSRDLTGFVDGTANPPIGEAPSAACIPAGSAGAGGSHVLTQRWVHDLAGFGALPVEEQERVFGRTKADSVALPADVRPADAHVSLAEIVDAAGEERPIYRRSTPFGTGAEQGLYFVAFSTERDRFDEMLARMYGTGGRELRDRLLDWSTPVTGACYFAPGADVLAALSGR
jgi:putative iron-dependent peroxidase